MRQFLLLSLLSVSLLIGSSARAELCTPDPVPGATLLIPYFEVSVPTDCSKARYDTTVSVTNVSAAPQLAHVVVWSEWSVPLLGFTIELTGYDVDSFRLSDVVCRGLVRNEDSGATRSFATNTIEHAKAILTGRQSPVTNMCGGHFERRSKAIGYITIDVVSSEEPGFPADGAGYMSALAFDNVLLGDIYYHDSKAKGATRVCGRNNTGCIRRFKKAIFNERGIPGVRAVSLEAGSASDFSPGDRTFYGRYVNAQATDRREPLPNIYHVRYAQAKRSKKFELIVWREGNSTSETVSCDSEPSFHPMGMTQIVAFDDNSDPIDLGIDDTPLGIVSFHDEVTVVKNALQSLPFDEGWLYLNFNTFFSDDNAYGDGFAGSYVMIRRDGRISTTGVHTFSGNADCTSSTLVFGLN